MSKKRKSTVATYLSYYFAQPFIFLIRSLPHTIALRIARLVGMVAYYLMPIRKKTVLQNLRRAFGKEKSEKELRRIARQCYQNFSMTVTEFIRMPVMDSEYLASLIEQIEGEEYFNQVGREKGGYLVVSGHLGNWEMVGSYFASIGVPVSVVARPMHNPLWDRAINAIREKKGMRVISTRASPKLLISHIREGRAVAFLVDQDARGAGIWVDFFGHPASTFTGPAVFLQRFRMPILPMYTVRTGLARHKVIFKPPIYPELYFKQVKGCGEEQENRQEREAHSDVTRQIVQQYTSLLESVIREYPEQYFWFHRRWKTTSKKLNK